MPTDAGCSEVGLSPWPNDSRTSSAAAPVSPVTGSGRGGWRAPVGDPRAWGRGQRRWMAGSSFALVFVVPYFAAALSSPHSVGWKAAATALLVAFSAVYVIGPALVFSAKVPRLLVLSLLLALSLAIFPFFGLDTCGLWIYLGVAAAMLLPARVAVGVAVVLAAGMLVLSVLKGEEVPWEQALILLAITGLMVGFAGNIRLTRELHNTREELAAAAVAAERARIGRDLHDILGHSLTAIAVKAGLARRLTGLDPAAAATEIADVELLAREALSDVRATASGFREVSLASELAVAAAVLRAAGIRAVLPTAVDDVLPQARELFGYVVREAVTNAVRHSGATTVTVTVGPRSVEIADDGRCGRSAATGAGRAETAGCGLTGLRDRVLAAGGRLETGPRTVGGFRVAVTVPAGPVPPVPASGSASASGSADPVRPRPESTSRPVVPVPQSVAQPVELSSP